MEDFQDTTATKKIFQLQNRIRAVCGGTSASKTISIIVWYIDYAQTHKNKKLDIFAESYPHLADGAIRDFKNIMMAQGYWEDNRWNSTEKVYTFSTQSIIKFIAVNKMGKAKGPRRDVGFVNEANHAMSWEIFDQLLTRTKEVMWLDWNPSTEFWYDEKIKGHREHDFLRLTYQDCLEALDPRIVEEIESHKGDVNWWKVYGLGELGDIKGRIYTGWEIIDDIPHEARLERYGLNFGYTNHPLGLVAIYYYNGGYILDEILYGKGINNKLVADTIINQPRKALTVADSAEPKSIDDIKGYGVNIQPAVKGQGSVNYGIEQVQMQQINVTSRSLNIIKEFRNYMWMVDRDGNVINTPAQPFHYIMDAIRYGITSVAPVIKRKEIIDNMPRIWHHSKGKNKTNIAR